MTYLVDANIFLEILLSQERQEACKRFLVMAIGNICISDFSLHSIGVILFRNNKENIFQKFAKDVIPKVRIVTLSKESYKDLVEIRNKLELDFDDAYQYKVANDYNLEIVTMDNDFKKVKRDIKVIFLK
ncbi:MAG: DNA-binding protein [Nitrospinae bacterium RIFCSPLOWO2_01_FULL_39_10]|nr:MAG: DNA-binding protein [Nitrospinae bacterium RIFCSPLOWO2_01_FULL_39_10]